MIVHYDGSSWSVVSSPNKGTDSSQLSGITAVAANNLWAVGSYVDSKTGNSQTLAEQWNGSKWSIVTSPSPNAPFNILAGVAHDPSSSQVWAVGATGTNPGKTLTEFFC